MNEHFDILLKCVKFHPSKDNFLGMKVKAYLVLCLLLSGIAGYANEASDTLVILNKERKQIILPLNRLPFWEDTTAKAKLDDVLDKPFRLHPAFTPSEYNINSAYWVKLTIYRPDTVSSNWLIEFYDQTIDRIEAYDVSEGRYRELVLGDELNFGAKRLRHKNFHLWLEEDGNAQYYTFYFRIQSRTYADIRIAIRSANRFINYALTEYFLYGIFYGMILIISIYNTLTYLAIRERKYLFYTFYILSVGVYAMSVDGVAYQYLWPSFSEWNQIAYGVALFSLIFWAIQFSRRFLSSQMRAPKLDKLLVGILIARSVWFVIALLFNNHWFAYRGIEIVPLTLIFYTSIRIWQRGYKPARFFVLAYGFLFLGFIVKAMIYLGIIPHSTPAYYSLHIGFLLEMVFLTLALSDRVKILKDNRDRALKRIISQHEQNAALREKVNRELEQKIRERTRSVTEKNTELEEANNKLARQSQEINQINSLLDLENWKLKNNIKEILKDRLMHEELSYEEFKEIFPNKDACMNYIRKLKWGNGYRCKRCGHDKHHDEAKMSRRCSKCGYLESVTSNTLFHGIKFPIEKAFFILYITKQQKDKYTLQELSDLLGLRLNTVWSFRKKIQTKTAKMESEVDIFVH